MMSPIERTTENWVDYCLWHSWYLDYISSSEPSRPTDAPSTRRPRLAIAHSTHSLNTARVSEWAVRTCLGVTERSKQSSTHCRPLARPTPHRRIAVETPRLRSTTVTREGMGLPAHPAVSRAFSTDVTRCRWSDGPTATEQQVTWRRRRVHWQASNDDWRHDANAATPPSFAFATPLGQKVWAIAASDARPRVNYPGDTGNARATLVRRARSPPALAIHPPTTEIF